MYDFNQLKQVADSLSTVKNDSEAEKRIRSAKMEQSIRLEKSFYDICDFAARMSEILPDYFSLSHEYGGYCSLRITYKNGTLSWNAFDSSHKSTCIIFKREEVKKMLDCSDQIRSLLIDFYNNWEAFLYDGCEKMKGKSFIGRCIEEISKKTKQITEERSSQLEQYLL